MTGIDRRKCHKLLKGLVAKNVLKRSVVQKGDKRQIFYGFQKDYEQWEGWPNKVTDTQKGDKESSKEVTKLSPKKTPSKEKKEIPQKKYTQQVEAIYAAYPKKADKRNTLKSITKILKAGTPLEILAKAVDNYKADIERKGTGRKYIIQSNNFFGCAARWEEFKDGSYQLGSQTGERSRCNYPKCPQCGYEASNVKVDKEGNLIDCPYCPSDPRQ
jgi:hypothetical protein